LSQFTRLTDGQTDGRTEFSSLSRVFIPCSAVKTLMHDRVAIALQILDNEAVPNLLW